MNDPEDENLDDIIPSPIFTKRDPEVKDPEELEKPEKEPVESKQEETEDPEVKDPEEPKIEPTPEELRLIRLRRKKLQEEQKIEILEADKGPITGVTVCPNCGHIPKDFWIVGTGKGGKVGEFYCRFCELGFYTGKPLSKPKEPIFIPPDPSIHAPTVEKIDPSRICPSCKGIDTLRSDQAFPSVHVCANCGVYV